MATAQELGVGALAGKQRWFVLDKPPPPVLCGALSFRDTEFVCGQGNRKCGGILFMFMCEVA